MNTFHDCAANECQVTQTSIVVQEHVSTDHFKNEIAHNTNPDDRLLNTAQLRSAKNIQQFCVDFRYPDLAVSEVISKAIANKHQLDDEASRVKQTKATEKQARAEAKEKRAEAKRVREACRHLGQPSQSQPAVDNADSIPQLEPNTAATGLPLEPMQTVSRKRGRGGEEEFEEGSSKRMHTSLH